MGTGCPDVRLALRVIVFRIVTTHAGWEQDQERHFPIPKKKEKSTLFATVLYGSQYMNIKYIVNSIILLNIQLRGHDQNQKFIGTLR